MIETTLVRQYAIFALIVWLTSLGLGGGLGAISAFLVRSVLARRPGLYGLIALLPWRSVVLNVMLVCFLYTARESVILTMLNFTGTALSTTLAGLGRYADLLAASLLMTLLAWALTASLLVARWHPTSIAVRITSLSRTLATTTIVVSLMFEIWANDGIGSLWLRYLGFLDIANTLNLWLQISIWLLIIDLGFGIGQMLVQYLGGLWDRLQKRNTNYGEASNDTADLGS